MAAVKLFHLVKRKPHLTHAQFRAHFERSHAAMAMKFCGHLFTAYRRNYVDGVFGGGDSRMENSGYGPMDWDWDLISEWHLPSEEALRQVFAIMESPECQALFKDDEDRFIDRTMNVMVPVAVCDTGTGFDPAGTVFDTPCGSPNWDGWKEALPPA